ncbi:MAG: aromatic amino acid ammonia-lyase [Longimonas sp.]|uniref:HAL/PAL/TAL family ammonia-lyase n=1 Tax=Longimonas sp. TaxID=2039626 RepID=UPI00335E314D
MSNSSSSASQEDPLALGPNVTLPPAVVEQFSTSSSSAVVLTSAAETACQQARATLETLREQEAPLYGVTTGFGPLVQHDSAPTSQERAQSLVAHLTTGTGPLMPRPVTRAMLLLRLHALSQGHSGIRRPVLHALRDLINASITPAIPSIGSVGASGDLTPLAFVARVLTGSGTCLDSEDQRVPAEAALEAADIEPVMLDARDALGIVNGTSFMTAYLALACARAQRLLVYAETHTGWIFRLLGASLEPLDPALHEARGHRAQVESATVIREAAENGDYAQGDNRPLQEIYSLRCAPQVLGACRDQIGYATRITKTELNGVSDNPLLFHEPPRAIHGGNFQGQQIAFAADALNAALTQIGVLMERQLDLLLTPAHNGGAPPLLAWTPGATHGFAGAQLTATALVAELRQRAQMTATSSIPTNGGNQDVVSMGSLAARTAYEQTPHVARILSIHALAALQLRHLQRDDRATGPAPAPPSHWPDMPPLTTDRPLHDELNAFADTLLAPPSSHA